MDKSFTEQLAYWLHHWKKAGLPDEVLETASSYVLDWLGSALAGGQTEPGKHLHAYAHGQPNGPCSLVGAKKKVSAESSALINGGLSHIVEMDDLDRDSVVHPGAVIIPAALAIAEREQCSGKEFLSAIVMGYEIAIRVGEAVGKRHYYYFHNTSTCGVFGAAVAAGWLLGLNQQEFVWAMGNAGTQAAGLWEFNTEGAMSKHLHAGRAAANGILAADLAQLGFTGARLILEGQRGFFAATAPDAFPSRVLDNLNFSGHAFKIKNVSIKPHASCRHTHPAIDAALAIHPKLNGKSIHKILIETYQAALDLCDNPAPKTPYAAKFSLQYCVASALERNSAGLTDFSDDAIFNQKVRHLMEHTSVIRNPEFESRYPDEWPTSIQVTLTNGEILTKVVEHPKGDPENPLTPSELEEKFHQLATFSNQNIETSRWVAWVKNLLKVNRITLL